VRRAIAAALTNVPCSTVSVDDQPGATPTLRGVVVSGQNESAMYASVRDAAPSAVPEWQVATADGPYCGVLDAVRPYAQRPGGGPALNLGLRGGRTDLTADELIIPQITMPGFAGSLQLDYVTGDGSVLHMHEALAGAPYAALSAPVFGQPKLPEFGGWAVDKPFGTDLIVGIASSVPLFRSPRPAGERLDGYLRDLNVALTQAVRDGARVSTTVLVVRTRPKR
jgi:hypothetical protein